MKRKGQARAVSLAAAAVMATLMSAGAARAQWTQPSSGGHISNTNTGNVGVGTASPQATLHVERNADGDAGLYLLNAGGGANSRSLFLLGEATNNARYAYMAYHGANHPTRPNSTLFANAGVGGFHIFSYGGAVQTGGTITFNTAPALAQGGNDAAAERMRIDKNGNVGVGTAAPARQLNVHQSAGGAKGLLLSGDEFYQSGNGGADGVAILLGVNRPGNRQLWIGDSTAIGSATLGMVRYMTGTSLPYVDATTGDGLTRLNVGFATATTNALVGANDVSVVQPASKLSVMGNLSVGFNYPATAAPANGAIIEGNVGIGTSAPTERLHVNGNLKVTGNIEAKYQDVAEWVPTTQKLAAGTVVVLDPSRSNHVLASGSAYDTSVAGVVSAQPGLILGEGGEGKVKVATTGRVRVRVDATRGPIRIGDLLVTSDAAGVAMRSEPVTVGGRPIHAPGTIIGKALEPLAKGVGEILVLLSMQ